MQQTDPKMLSVTILLSLFLFRLLSPMVAAQVSLNENEFACNGTGLYPDVKEHCSPIYYSCAHGIAVKRFCPKNLFFDLDVNSCNRYIDTAACKRQNREGQPDDSILSFRIPPEAAPVECTDNSSFHEDPFRPCSPIFYQCSDDGQDVYRMVCPSGKFYDHVNETCAGYQKVSACSKQLAVTVEANLRKLGLLVASRAEKSRTIGRLIEERTKSTRNLGFGPANSSENDVICVLGVDIGEPGNLASELAHMIGAGDGEIQDLQLISKRRLRFVCRERYASKLRLLSEQNKGGLMGFKHDGRFIPIVKVLVFARHEDQDMRSYCHDLPNGNYRAGACDTYFIVCVHGRLSLHPCPADTVYDRERHRCENPENLPECGGARPLIVVGALEERKVEPTKRVQATSFLINCLQKSEGNYAKNGRQGVEHCSRSYFSCANGQAHEFQCPGSLYFNPRTRICDLKFRIDACLGYLDQRSSQVVTAAPGVTESALSPDTNEPPTAHFLPVYRVFWETGY